MAITMDGKIANAGNLRALDGLFRNQTVGYANIYLGFTTGATPIADDSILSTISECSGISRTDVTSNFGTAAALDSAVPEISNDSAINTANASEAETITGWFITNASSGTVGNILAYGNDDANSLNTNVGSPITIDIGGLVINLD